MTSPRTAWRRARFGATALLALPVLLVAVLAVGEWRGWTPLLQISAPACSKAPHLLRAEGASVDRASGRWGEWPLNAELTPAGVGRSSLEFKGHAGVTLPTTRTFRTEGELKREGPLWHVLVSAATVGANRLDGDFRYDAARRIPLLSGGLGGPRLLLSDLGPAVGVAPESAKPRKGSKVLPDRPFDLAALRVMDAEVALAIEEVDLNTNQLEPL